MAIHVKSESMDGVIIEGQGMFNTVWKQSLKDLLEWRVVTNLSSFFRRSTVNKRESVMWISWKTNIKKNKMFWRTWNWCYLYLYTYKHMQVFTSWTQNKLNNSGWKLLSFKHRTFYYFKKGTSSQFSRWRKMFRSISSGSYTFKIFAYLLTSFRLLLFNMF